jgi:hypothetical protein
MNARVPALSAEGLAKHARYIRAKQLKKRVSCAACGECFARTALLERHLQAKQEPLWKRALKKRYKNLGGFRLLTGGKYA